MPELHVLAAGSLIEFVLDQISYPVGRIDTLAVTPLRFAEYLNAVNKRHYWEKLRQHPLGQEVPEGVHRDLLFELKKYMRVGGMPEALSTFIESKDYGLVSDVHERLFLSYRNDFVKYSKKNEWDVLERVFERSPHVVGDSRVKYNRLDPDSRSAKVKKILQLLYRAGLLYPVIHSSAKQPPLSILSSDKTFKVLSLDVGLLQYMLGFNWSIISPDDELTSLADGRLAEQFVGQEIISTRSHRDFYSPDYWDRHKQGSDAEIDYLVELSGEIIPLEVKSWHRGTFKSLKLYMDKLQSSYGIVLSQRNFEQLDDFKWMPLYFAGLI